MTTEEKQIVVVTGFGPFGEHTVNASWEVAKLLPSLDIESEHNVKLVIEEIPVEYEAVSKRIPELWQEHKPVLVVHLGVSSIASGLTVESCARATGYEKPDVTDRTPPNQCCCDSDGTLRCQLDVKSFCRVVNSSELGVTSQTSSFAGLYLCEFAFFTSLNIDASRAVFVHVPALGKGLSVDQMARGVARVLGEALAQIRRR